MISSCVVDTPRGLESLRLVLSSVLEDSILVFDLIEEGSDSLGGSLEVVVSRSVEGTSVVNESSIVMLRSSNEYSV